MYNEKVFYLIFLIIMILNISLILKPELWRKFQLYTLKHEEKWAKNNPWYRKIVEKEIKFAKGKYGLWLFRGLGLAWLFYTLILLLSVLREMRT